MVYKSLTVNIIFFLASENLFGFLVCKKLDSSGDYIVSAANDLQSSHLVFVIPTDLEGLLKRIWCYLLMVFLQQESSEDQAHTWLGERVQTKL